MLSKLKRAPLLPKIARVMVIAMEMDSMTVREIGDSFKAASFLGFGLVVIQIRSLLFPKLSSILLAKW